MENRLKKLKISQLRKVYSKMVKMKHTKIKKKDMINRLLQPLKNKYKMSGTEDSDKLSSDLMKVLAEQLDTKNLSKVAITSKDINEDMQSELDKRIKEKYSKLSMIKKYKKFKIIPYLISSQKFKYVNDILDKFEKYSDLLGYDISDLNEKDIDEDDRRKIMRTPLIYAILKGEEEIIKKLIRLGVDINITDETRDGQSGRENALFYLIRSDKFTNKKKLELLKYFVDNGGNIYTQNANGSTLLMAAITSKCGKDIIKYLINKGIGVNETNDLGFSPLMAAIIWNTMGGNHLPHVNPFKNNLEIIKILVENGADVNARMRTGWTPLKWAIDRKSFEIVKYLVENGAEIEDISYDQGQNNNNIEYPADIEALDKIKRYLRDKKRMEKYKK